MSGGLDEEGTEITYDYFEIQLSTFVIICVVTGLLFVLVVLIAVPASYYISKRRLNKRLNKGSPKSRIYNAYLYIPKVATAFGVDVKVDTFSALQDTSILCITKSGF